MSVCEWVFYIYTLDSLLIERTHSLSYLYLKGRGRGDDATPVTGESYGELFVTENVVRVHDGSNTVTSDPGDFVLDV